MAARRNPGYLLHIASTSCLVIVGAKLRKKIEVVLCKARGLGLPKIKKGKKLHQKPVSFTYTWKLTKVWVKKIGHMFCLITQKVSTVEKILLSKGQIDLFRGLKWGIVRLCSSKNAGDMAKNLKE